MALGVDAAAELQLRLVARAILAAKKAASGPITLWGEPHIRDAIFADLGARHAITIKAQPPGVLGLRVAAILGASAPAIVVNADCPQLTSELIAAAANALAKHSDVVFCPTDAGGCALIGMREFRADIFSGLDWTGSTCVGELRSRLAHNNVRWSELPTVWTVERPSDLRRLQRDGLGGILNGLRDEIPSMMAARA